MTSNHILDLNNVDSDYNVFRYEKFKIDIKDKKINKICMTEIVNADLMIATFGEDAYALGCKEVLTQGREDLKAAGLENVLIHYMYNYKNFIVAGTEDISDKDFETLMRQVYENYVHTTAHQAQLSALSRFVLVFGDDLINRAKSAFYHHRKSQNNYIIASNEKEVLVAENTSDIEIFNLINYAINNDKVIPYYQGLYNNNLGKVDRYEALMRISDKDGQIYNPGIFLEISKKYKLYPTLSKQLIGKVLDDFRYKETEFSINISLFDVENPEFIKWFIDLAKDYPNIHRLTVEFVETENYNSGQELHSFLNTMRDFGCKIAVDDFGVGFSTYTSIIALKPDVIKIDGEIIKNLTTSDDSRIILESINYMANLINCKSVAEFVEDKHIQQILIDEKIDYSQGYYFSKPKPIEELDIK